MILDKSIVAIYFKIAFLKDAVRGVFMICGKCNCEKKNIHLSQSFQTTNGHVHIHNIPAIMCECETIVPQSVLMEISNYCATTNSSGITHIQFEDI